MQVANSNKAITLLLILLSFSGCRNTFGDQYKIQNCHLVSIELHGRSVSLSDQQKLVQYIKTTIIESRKIEGPLKGVGIPIIFNCKKDSGLTIMSMGGSRYFSYQDRYFEARRDLLTDSLKNILMLGRN